MHIKEERREMGKENTANASGERIHVRVVDGCLGGNEQCDVRKEMAATEAYRTKLSSGPKKQLMNEW